jgi:hypothetical protein
MNTALILVLSGIMVAVMAALIVYGFAQARQRTTDLQAAAQEIGFTFEGDWTNPTLAGQLKTALFKRGGAGRPTNVMTGTSAGFKAGLFDYSYTISTGKSSSTITQTVAAYSQDRSLPLFEMRPEGFLDRVGDAFVHADIDFDSHPEFSRRYLLRGPEPDEIRSLFTPALLTFLERLCPEDKWHIEGGGVTLILYRTGVTLEAAALRSFLNETSSIAGTFFSCCGARKS